MRDYHYRPPNDLEKTVPLVGMMGLVAATFFVMSVLVGGAKGLLQLGFMIFVVAAIYIVIRYALTNYTYSVTDRYGEPMLIVTVTAGKRISCVCRIPLGDIHEICEDTKDRGRVDGEKRYNYCQGIGSPCKKLVIATVDGVNLAVALDMEEEFENILRASIHKMSE